jgi:hypothetical protein
MTLCPYDAMCPGGPGSNPAVLMTIIPIGDDGDVQRSPILGGGTEMWVRLGGERACQSEAWDPPPAAVDGGGGGDVVDVAENVMCCVPVDGGDGGTSDVAVQDADEDVAAENQIVAEEIVVEAEVESGELAGAGGGDGGGAAAIVDAAIVDAAAAETSALLAASYKKYEPQWYDRATGWSGSSYGEAMEFCSAMTSFITERLMTLCPYDAMCPGGPGSNPAVLMQSVDDVQRSPVLDLEGVWVFVGGEKVCMGELWDTSESNAAGGGESEEMAVTGLVMCCAPQDDAAEGQGEVIVADYLGTEAVGGASYDADEYSSYDFAKEKYRPIVYDRSTGWVGETYDSAVTWCASSERDGETMILCPYEAYCPEGPHSVPYGGYGYYGGYAADERMFAPISNQLDWWVDIGTGDTCMLYEEGPDWGSDGTTGDDPLPTRILCCVDDSPGGIGRPVDVGDALETTTAATVDSTSVEVDVAGAATDAPATEIATVPPPSPPATVSVAVAVDDSSASTTTAVATVAADDSSASVTTAVATAPAMVDWGGVGLNDDTGPTTASALTMDVSDESALVLDTLQSLAKKFSPISYDRASGWQGQVYIDALQFCSDMGSLVPCPYDAYCPLGPGQHVVGGRKNTTSYAPLMSIPNGWVSIGPDNTCMPYNAYNPVPPEWGLTGEGNEEITRHIMCCAEPEAGSGIYLSEVVSDGLEYDTAADVTSLQRSEAEQSIMDEYHPVWYSHRQGYHGTTIEEAEFFCNNVAGKTLCPLDAVCPDGPPSESTHAALFLDRPSFDGEQWAPISGIWSGELRPDWVSIGMVGGAPTSTCLTLTSLQDAAKLWDGGDSRSEHKQYVLCCGNLVANDSVEDVMKTAVDPVWYNEGDGWVGGSNSDGAKFCAGRNGRELCPYPAYCPYGEGKSVMGGHRDDFDRQGEQWAPATNDIWVMIGQKFRNSATTCTSGSPPMDDETVNLKKHIMCCRPVPGG